MVPMNTPSASWVRRSSTKLRISRGPSWLAASVSTTMVIDSAKAVIVMIAVTKVASSRLASAALPECSHHNDTPSRCSRKSADSAATAMAPPSRLMTPGTSQSEPRRCSQARSSLAAGGLDSDGVAGRDADALVLGAARGARRPRQIGRAHV